MTTVAQRKKAKRASRPVYLVVRKLVDPDTGELIGALVPAHPIDARLMRDRKFHVNREVRAELKQRRNVKFHRLAHAVGQLLVEHVEGFESLDSHGAFKRVQRECGACCEEMDMELPGIGKLTVKVPESIAFDEMPEDRFALLFEAVTRHIDTHYAAGLTDDVRGEYLLMIEGNA